MAAELLRNGEWYDLIKWEKRSFFFTRAPALCCHSNGTIYAGFVGVNRKTNGWDGLVIAVAPNGAARLHHEWVVGRNLDSNAAALAMDEIKAPNQFAGNIVISMTTATLDFSPAFWVITP